jgi:hypothetical protein
MVILSKTKKSINQTKSASSTTFKMPDKRRNSTRFITTTGHICDNEIVLFITVASFLVTQRKSQKGNFMGHENRLVSSQHVLGGGGESSQTAHILLCRDTCSPECKTVYAHLTCQSTPTRLTYLRPLGDWEIEK